MTPKAAHPVPDLVDDIAVISRFDRQRQESPEDYLVRLAWFTRDKAESLEGDLSKANTLLEEMRRDAEHLPILGPVLQTIGCVAPLVPLMFWLGRPAIAYAVWLTFVCLGPVVSAGAYKLISRLRHPSAVHGEDA